MDERRVRHLGRCERIREALWPRVAVGDPVASELVRKVEDQVAQMLGIGKGSMT